MQLFGSCDDEKIIEIHGDDKTAALELPESTGGLFDPNISKIDSVSIELDLMRYIEDLNQISSCVDFDERKPDVVQQLKVNYAHILSALELTMKSMEPEVETNTEIADECVLDVDERKKQIGLLWQNFRKIFPDEHVHMWSSLQNALTDYLLHLKKRQKLHEECDRLRRQNAQLKYMLQELL